MKAHFAENEKKPSGSNTGGVAVQSSPARNVLKYKLTAGKSIFAPLTRACTRPLTHPPPLSPVPCRQVQRGRGRAVRAAVTVFAHTGQRRQVGRL